MIHLMPRWRILVPLKCLMTLPMLLVLLICPISEVMTLEVATTVVPLILVGMTTSAALVVRKIVPQMMVVKEGRILTPLSWMRRSPRS